MKFFFAMFSFVVRRAAHDGSSRAGDDEAFVPFSPWLLMIGWRP